MAKELTVKQKKFVSNKAKGMSGAEAARQAGYSPHSAREIAAENLSKPNIRDAFLTAMEKAGITDEKVSGVLKDGLEANRVISAVILEKHGDDSNATDKTNDFIEVPDHPTRLKAVSLVKDIKGLEAAKQVNLRDQTLEDLLSLEDD